MANIKASKKDIRKSAKRRDQNSQQRARLRTLDKKIRKLVTEENLEEAKSMFRTYTVFLDRAGRKNLIHPRQADRRKSRMAVLVNGKSASKTA